MQARSVKILFQRFQLRRLRLAALHAPVKNRCQGFAQLYRRRPYSLRILCAHRPDQSPRLLGSQQPQLRNQAQKICISRKEFLRLCGKTQIQRVHQLERRMPGEQLKRLKTFAHQTIITLKNTFRGYPSSVYNVTSDGDDNG